MNRRIIVLLKKRDRIEEFVPFIETLVQPGTTVVFLVYLPVSGLQWLQAYCVTSQCGVDNALAVRRSADSYSKRVRLQMARQQILNKCGVLRRMGVEMAVDVYSGSPRAALRAYGTNQGDLVLERMGMAERITSFLSGTASILGQFGRPFPASMILQYRRVKSHTIAA